MEFKTPYQPYFTRTCCFFIPRITPGFNYRPATSHLTINQPSNILPIPSSWSLSAPPSNTSFESIEHEFRQLQGFSTPKCDAAAYGRALQLSSCREAQKMIPTDKRILTFGVRNRGRWNVNLPYRWSSCLSALSFISCPSTDECMV